MILSLMLITTGSYSSQKFLVNSSLDPHYPHHHFAVVLAVDEETTSGMRHSQGDDQAMISPSVAFMAALLSRDESSQIMVLLHL